MLKSKVALSIIVALFALPADAFGMGSEEDVQNIIQSIEAGDARDSILRGVDVDTAVTALGILVDAGQEDALVILLEAGADPNRRFAEGGTPLFAAIMSDKLSIARKLLEHGADPNFEVDGVTAVDLARALGSPDMQALFGISDFNRALLIASASGDPEGVQKLLAAGADPNAKDEAGQTAMTIAAIAGSKEAISGVFLRLEQIPTLRRRRAPLPLSVAILQKRYGLAPADRRRRGGFGKSARCLAVIPCGDDR